jgi:hypothetical protein
VRQTPPSTYRSVGVQVTTHVLDLELQLLLGALLGTLCPELASTTMRH